MQTTGATLTQSLVNSSRVLTSRNNIFTPFFTRSISSLGSAAFLLCNAASASVFSFASVVVELPLTLLLPLRGIELFNGEGIVNPVRDGFFARFKFEGLWGIVGESGDFPFIPTPFVEGELGLDANESMLGVIGVLAGLAPVGFTTEFVKTGKGFGAYTGGGDLKEEGGAWSPFVSLRERRLEEDEAPVVLDVISWG